ncbi:hypothetical protein GOBAR_DD28776 [Gossypium barbadense]|nr:hypothetical protein GOBAR_DD28776 [Gossypium barbadense]
MGKQREGPKFTHSKLEALPPLPEARAKVRPACPGSGTVWVRKMLMLIRPTKSKHRLLKTISRKQLAAIKEVPLSSI